MHIKPKVSNRFAHLMSLVIRVMDFTYIHIYQRVILLLYYIQTGDCTIYKLYNKVKTLNIHFFIVQKLISIKINATLRLFKSRFYLLLTDLKQVVMH